jgi:TolB-like protein
MNLQPLSQPQRRRLFQALLVAGMVGLGLGVGQPDAMAGQSPPLTVAAKPTPASQAQRIAVVDFRALGCPVSYGEAVAENFRNALIAEHRYVVLERNQIKQAIKEQTFTQSGLVDQTNAVAIGRLIGARYIVVGSITRLGRTYTVNARFIDVQTGEASNARSHSTESEDDLADLVSDLAKAFGEAADGRSDDTGPRPAPGRRPPGAPNPDTWGREDAPPPAAPRKGTGPTPDPNTWGLEDAPPPKPPAANTRKPAGKPPAKPPAKPALPAKAPQKPGSPSPSPSTTPDPHTWGLE